MGLVIEKGLSGWMDRAFLGVVRGSTKFTVRINVNLGMNGNQVTALLKIFMVIFPLQKYAC